MFGLYKNFGYRRGYTLAEMLVVLAIISMIMLAMPPVTKKVFKVDATAKKHGRVECYWNENGKLVQYNATELGHNTHPFEPDNADQGCHFQVPSNALYIMIHAVGAGGAGKDVDGNFDFAANKSSAQARSTISYSTAGTWPEWFTYFLKHRPKDLKLDYSNSFELQKSYTKQILPFGVSGQAGETVSLFFPQLSSTTDIVMHPGKGGVVGNDNDKAKGEDTTVDFVYNYKSSNRITKRAITAKGGDAGVDKYNFSTELYGGKATDFGVGSMQAVKIKSSKFEDLLEDTGTDIAKTNINKTYDDDPNSSWGSKLNAGYGGNGGYYYLDGDKLAGDFIYMVNNFSERYEGGYLGKVSSKNSGYGQYAIAENRKTRTDHWFLITKYINPNFYKINGRNGNCTTENVPAKGITVQGPCFSHQDHEKVGEYYCTIPFLKNANDVEMINFPFPSLFAIYDSAWAATHQAYFKVDPVTGAIIEKQWGGAYFDDKNIVNEEWTPVTWGGVTYYRQIGGTVGSAGYITACNEFDINTKSVTCKLNMAINKAKHHCAGYANKEYENPYDKEITCENNKCKASDGGNGAVVIIW